MLNDKQEHELAYVVVIEAVFPIQGKDNIEYAIINDQKIIVPKDIFKPGDPAIYIEKDSRIPKTPQFDFLQSRSDDIFWTKGILIAVEELGWKKYCLEDETPGMIDDCLHLHFADDESRFLTYKLGVKSNNEEEKPSSHWLKRLIKYIT